jgi:hypothetical protein
MLFKVHDEVENGFGHRAIIVADIVSLTGVPYYVIESVDEGRLQIRSHLYAASRFKLIERKPEGAFS